MLRIINGFDSIILPLKEFAHEAITGLHISYIVQRACNKSQEKSMASWQCLGTFAILTFSLPDLFSPAYPLPSASKLGTLLTFLLL